jgi:hypothetical protein
MPRSIILNQTNIVPNTGNSILQYNFPTGGAIFTDELIAVQQVSLYQSVFNITVANNNNSFSYIWVDGTVNQVLIPDGYYNLIDINAFFQSVMVSNLHYMESDTAYIYFLEIVVNQTAYAYQINCFQLSASIATANTWTQPSGSTWLLPTNSIIPIFIVPATNFQNLIGFNAGKYPNADISGTPPAQIETPSYATTLNFLSQNAPQIVPQSSYLCLCNLVNNRLAIPSQLIYSLTPTSAPFGEIYSIQVSELAFNKIENGQYTNIRFEFRDQLGAPIAFQDPQMLILLLIKNKSELTYLS